MDKTSIAIGVIVGAIVVLLFFEVHQSLEAAKAWCHSYNGTVIAEHEVLECKFPNGTTKPLPPQNGGPF